MEQNEITTKPSVGSVGLKFGLILGLVSVASSLIQTAIDANPLENNWTKNILMLAISVAIIVFAHKNFKDNGDGYMSYGQGLGIAMVAVMVSIVISGIYSYIYFTMVDPSIFERIWEKAEEDMEAKGQNAEQIEMGLKW